MAVEVVVPHAEAGEGMEVSLARWLKREGDHVRAGEPLFELDTDKATLEVEAVADGVVAGIQVREGEQVEPRQVVAYLLAAGEQLQERTAGSSAKTAPSETGRARTSAGATPRARELAREHGIDLGALAGTGPGGFVTTQDVEAAIAERGRPT